ncbi:NrsF family protein [Reyranella sp. CPCC 100927]|uniref:NrsF family protein n=1 Tax=Reyranella sp. CPCC 100927 TaxID=2599616 RepID=UPI0011B3A7BE|nr:NrsF family protein [Reyranella sp. CPCC 100927]TWT10790.1 DUF1109 family protein [Reyranella sp. CPCC 100927]
MKTHDLIELLAQDAPPRKDFGAVFATAVALAVIAAGAVFFAGIGFRPDIAQAAETVRFLFKFVVTVSLAVSATVAVLRLSRPGVAMGGWSVALAAVPVLLGGAVVAELFAVPRDGWMTQLVGQNMRFCLTLIPLMAIGPLACLIVALRRGAPARPGLAGALAGLAAGGIAATFYASNCTDDSPLFVAAWYPLAILAVTAVGFISGRLFLRW